MERAVLKAEDLIVGWDQMIVAELDKLHVATGEIVVIAGPNGAGKSTALKTLARQIKPLGGSITIDGVDTSRIEPRAFARRLAYVPQMIEVPHNMTVEELVSLGRNPHQQWWSWDTSEEDSRAVVSSLEQAELLALRKRPVSELSGGERQRAAIAMALAQRTDFVLLDEPTAHLDFRHQLQLVDLLKQLRASGLGILLVLHDLNLTSQLADSVVLLSKNKIDTAKPSCIVRSGPPETVFDQETLRAVYQVDVSIIRDTASGFLVFMPTKAI